MARIYTIVALALLICSIAVAQGSTGKPPAPEKKDDPATLQEESSSRDTTTPVAPPSTKAAEKPKGKLRRTLDRALPNCASIIIVGGCWSEPLAPEPSKLPELEQKYRHEMEVGQLNLDDKAYKGAVMRFETALEYKPEDPAALFKLAQSHDKLKQADEARAGYQRYLELAPDGKYAAEAKTALARKPAGAKKEVDRR